MSWVYINGVLHDLLIKKRDLGKQCKKIYDWVFFFAVVLCQFDFIFLFLILLLMTPTAFFDQPSRLPKLPNHMNDVEMMFLKFKTNICLTPKAIKMDQSLIYPFNM